MQVRYILGLSAVAAPHGQIGAVLIVSRIGARTRIAAIRRDGP